VLYGLGVFCKYFYHSAGGVGLIIGTRRFEHDDLVDYTTGDKVEREGATVNLCSRGYVIVQIGEVVALVKSPHHHELVVHDAHARYALHGLCGITVGASADLLRGYTGCHHREFLDLLSYLRNGGMRHRTPFATHAGNHHFVQ